MNNWWRNIPQEWKRIFLINYEFNNDRGFISNEIISKGLLNAYAHNFGIGITERLKSFNPTNDIIESIRKSNSLIISYPGLNGLSDLSLLKEFDAIKHLVISGYMIIDFSELWNQTYLKTLVLTNCNNLLSLDNIQCLQSLEVLTLKCCYNLKKITVSCSLKKIDIYQLYAVIDLSRLEHVNEIILNKNMIHPDDLRYNKLFNIYFKNHSDYYKKNKTYHLIDSEIHKIMNSDLKENYLNMGLHKNKRDIIIISYDKWNLKKSNLTTITFRKITQP